jgi:outer membrane protein assembly factor BamB
MCRRIILACVTLVLWGAAARAQVPFTQDLLPTRTALARLGLERQWMAVVPLDGDERVLSISLSEDLFFAQSNKGYFHAYKAETGQHLWTVRLGLQTAQARPASVNSFGVFVTNLNRLFALHKTTGRTIWEKELEGTLPSCSTACDEDLVMAGFDNGKIYAYKLKEKDKKSGKVTLATKAIDAWNWQTGGKVETRPVPAGRLAVFGSDDGKVYVARTDEPTMIYRILTGGEIGGGLGTLGTRLLLIPSADHNLYAVDLLTSQVLWTYASGAPIGQAPLAVGDDIFVVNEAGRLSSLDPKTGSLRWTVSTQGGPLLAIGQRRIYLESHDRDLFIVDRVTGQILVDPRATHERAGLNTRHFELGQTNRQNDRIYYASNAGLVICIREIGQLTPHDLRDRSKPPFGTIPAEGITLPDFFGPKPVRPEELAPADSINGDLKLPDAKPAEKPAAKPAEEKPAEEKPAEEKPAEKEDK